MLWRKARQDRVRLISSFLSLKTIIQVLSSSLFYAYFNDISDMHIYYVSYMYIRVRKATLRQGKPYIDISILTQLSFISFTCFFYIFILNKNGWLNLISSFNELCNIPNFMLHVSITVTLISLLSLHNLCMTFQLVHNLIRRSFYTLKTCYKNKM